MSDKTLTDEGYLAFPSTSNQEVRMEPENTINEDELLAVSEDENSATNQVNVQTYNRQENVPANRKRRYSDTLQPEGKIKNAEKAIQALKRHIDKGTCPMSLKYKARANIKADKDFKTDVKRIRKYSESEYVKALMRFHYRDIERHRAELHRNKRPSFQTKTSTVSNVKSISKKGTPSAPESSNMNATNITNIAEDIQEKMVQFNTMMLKLQEMSNKPDEKYKCLFSESYANQGANNKQNLSN